MFGAMQGVHASEHFFAEAKRFFDGENGRRSLPTVQGLLIMFVYSTGMGRDRAGMKFRHMAYDMLSWLRLETSFHKATEASDGHRERVALSRVLWGIYCFERWKTLAPKFQIPEANISPRVVSQPLHI